jgi:hypothetical protein
MTTPPRHSAARPHGMPWPGSVVPPTEDWLRCPEVSRADKPLVCCRLNRPNPWSQSTDLPGPRIPRGETSSTQKVCLTGGCMLGMAGLLASVVLRSDWLAHCRVSREAVSTAISRPSLSRGLCHPGEGDRNATRPDNKALRITEGAGKPCRIERHTLVMEDGRARGLPALSARSHHCACPPALWVGGLLTLEWRGTEVAHGREKIFPLHRVVFP